MSYCNGVIICLIDSKLSLTTAVCKTDSYPSISINTDVEHRGPRPAQVNWRYRLATWGSKALKVLFAFYLELKRAITGRALFGFITH